jgi:aerotaxis receptor
MGLVKNRCKNGDYYWVNAYVTPVTVAGKVVGYESVRVSPKPEDVKKANNYYTRLNAAKKSMPKVPQGAFSSVLFLALLVSSFFVFKENWSLLCLAVLVEVCTFFGYQHYSLKKTLLSIESLLSNSFKHPVAVATYTDDASTVGSIKVAILSELSHLNTVLCRIENSANELSRESKIGLSATNDTKFYMDKQSNETEQVAAAMNEMSTAIFEVSKHVQETADNPDTGGLFPFHQELSGQVETNTHDRDLFASS